MNIDFGTFGALASYLDKKGVKDAAPLFRNDAQAAMQELADVLNADRQVLDKEPSEDMKLLLSALSEVETNPQPSQALEDALAKFNAVVINPPRQPATVAEWVEFGEVGLSSGHMAFCHDPRAAARYAQAYLPLDADDFGRCRKLVAAVPAVKQSFPRLSASSPAWGKIVAQWDALETAAEAKNYGQVTALLQEARGLPSPPPAGRRAEADKTPRF